MEAINSFIVTVISSMAAGGLAASAIVWLAKTVIGQRVKSAIEHEYASKLETYKAELRAQHEVALERFRAGVEREHASIAAATASFALGHGAASERRIQAMHDLWQAILRMRTKAHPIVGISDWLRPGDIKDFLASRKRRDLIDDLTYDRFFEFLKADDAIEALRPFLDEYVWALFYAYRAFTGRIMVIFIEGKETGTVSYWRDDEGVRRLLATVLSEQEQRELQNIDVLAISWVRTLLEQKILKRASEIMTGQASSRAAFEEARRIIAASEKVSPSPTPAP